jgi:serine/threonine-protein kinase PRP4
VDGRKDDWDDVEGYYRHVVGEVLDSRYKVVSLLGSGMFSTVVKAMDLKDDRAVAIKIIRNKDLLYSSAKKEIAMLQKLIEQDPMDKRHVIRLHGTFEHRKHLCLVFESLW